MKKAPTKEEVFGHRSLAWELLKAECAMKSISLNLSSLRFANHRKFKKETLKKTERLYSEIRTLRESIGNEFNRIIDVHFTDSSMDTPVWRSISRFVRYLSIRV